jgi:hypothetical protein
MVRRWVLFSSHPRISLTSLAGYVQSTLMIITTDLGIVQYLKMQQM